MLIVSHHAGVSSQLEGQRGSVLLNYGMYRLSKVKADGGDWVGGALEDEETTI